MVCTLRSTGLEVDADKEVWESDAVRGGGRGPRTGVSLDQERSSGTKVTGNAREYTLDP